MRAGIAIRIRLARSLAARAPMVGECRSDAECQRISGNDIDSAEMMARCRSDFGKFRYYPRRQLRFLHTALILF